jgi:hypothetical protein
MRPIKLTKGKVEKPSSSKYIPPHRRHIKGKDSVICENVNLNSAKIVGPLSSRCRECSAY